VKLVALLLLLGVSAVAQTTAGSSSSSSSPKSAPAQSEGAPATSKAKAATAPDDGSYHGNTYTSRYFGFSFTFPEHFTVDADFTEGQQDESQETFVLLAAFGPTAGSAHREGVVLTADKLEAPRHVHKLTLPGTPEAATVNHDDDWVQPYLDTLKHVLVSQGAQPRVGLRDYSFGGSKFYRADFERDAPGFQSLLLTRQGGYALVFDFVGGSEERVDKLVSTLDSLKFTKPKPGN
jgi:hypothetical protein